MIGKFIRAARLSWQALKAEEYAAQSDWDDAMAVLERMYSAAGVAPPSPRLPAELNILTCQVAIGLADGPLALVAAETALSQLRSGSGSYSAPDREYLDTFCQALVNYCLFWRDKGVVRSIDLRSVDLQQISRRLKKRFPMPDDGSWIGIPSDAQAWQPTSDIDRPD